MTKVYHLRNDKGNFFLQKGVPFCLLEQVYNSDKSTYKKDKSCS